jgi:hypothetical protein
MNANYMLRDDQIKALKLYLDTGCEVMHCTVEFFEPKIFFDLHIELMHIKHLVTDKKAQEEKKAQLYVMITVLLGHSQLIYPTKYINTRVC